MTLSEILRQSITQEIQSGTSLRQLEIETDVRRQSVVKFLRKAQTLRSDAIERLMARYQLEVRPVKKAR